MRQTAVWIISSEQWPRALLRAELNERGYEATGYLTIDQALVELLRRPEQKPQVIVLDLAGQAITRARLTALGRASIPTIVFGGAIELDNPLVGEFPWAGSLKRPFTIGEVVAKIEAIVSPTG